MKHEIFIVNAYIVDANGNSITFKPAIYGI